VKEGAVVERELLKSIYRMMTMTLMIIKKRRNVMINLEINEREILNEI